MGSIELRWAGAPIVAHQSSLDLSGYSIPWPSPVLVRGARPRVHAFGGDGEAGPGSRVGTGRPHG
jgi:hypothetical protein